MGKQMPFRDVTSILRTIRQFLLGRKHTLHVRFEPTQSARSIPPPDIARGPEFKYSENYYYKRSPLRAVKPPFVATIGETLPGSKGGKPLEPQLICFNCAPAPGQPWGWDGHNYFVTVPDFGRASKPKRGPGCPTNCQKE